MQIRPIGTPNLGQNPIRWPELPELRTRLQQIQAASVPSRLSPSKSAQVSSANQPQPVSNLQISVRPSGSSRQVTVSFLHPQDPFFQKVNIYLVQGTGNPALMTSSTTSPVTFTVPKSALSSSVLVQSEGNWGPMPLSLSPGKMVRLA